MSDFTAIRFQQITSDTNGESEFHNAGMALCEYTY